MTTVSSCFSRWNHILEPQRFGFTNGLMAWRQLAEYALNSDKILGALELRPSARRDLHRRVGAEAASFLMSLADATVLSSIESVRCNQRAGGFCSSLSVDVVARHAPESDQGWPRTSSMLPLSFVLPVPFSLICALSAISLSFASAISISELRTDIRRP